MQLDNPFQMNDWEIKKFLKVLLAIQLAVWGVIAFDTMGVHIPLMRPLVVLIYLTLVPGIIILRILKLHNLGNIETLLYTVGLSIATLMFTGLVMNTVYPLLGVSGPISIIPLVITISVIVLVLCVLCYRRDKDFSEPSSIDVGDILSPPALFLCLIPFLALFGTYLVNFHHNNIILMVLIVILVLIVLLIGFDTFIPKNLYPLAVFVIALSLLYHRGLISMYLWGWDIHIEYYYHKLVMLDAIWNPTIAYRMNAMLALVMLPGIYAHLLNMDSTWVFKIIYPLLFSLVPLGLYRVFQKQTDDKIAFLSCFFFVSLFTFYNEMLALARQQIAELFLVLLILPMIDKHMDKLKRAFLFIVFGVSLAVSHYGLSYIYMFCLIAAWLLLASGEYPEMQKLMHNFYSKFGRKREKPAGNPVPLKVDRTISSTFVLLFIVFTLTWYMYVSASSAFDEIVRIGDHIARSIFTEFLNPEAAEGWDILTGEIVSPLHSVGKYLHVLSQFFIAVGVITLMSKRDGMKFEREYNAFTVVNFVICFAAIGVPYFASSLNTTRLYHVTLIFLTPFCVIGGVTVFKVLSRIVKASWTNKSVENSLKVLSLLFAIFLLFNSGWVYEVAKDHPGSISLSQEWIKNSKNIEDKVPLYNAVKTFEQDIYGVKWFSESRKNDKITYTDCTGRSPLVAYGMVKFETIILLSNTTKIRKETYTYLGYPNTVEKVALMKSQQKMEAYNTTELFHYLNTTNNVYANGGSEIYYNGET